MGACRTHFMRNLLTRVPKSTQRLVRAVFQQPNRKGVWAQRARVVEQLEERYSKATKLANEVLAFAAFPTAHWRCIWSNNPLTRLNKELKRCANVVGIFPNREAVLRLPGAVLAEQHDEWVVARVTSPSAPSKS